VSTRRTWKGPLVFGLLVVGTIIVVLWLVPSDHYLFLPDPAKPADAAVSVPDEKQPEGEAGIYYLEVTVRKANLLERLFPGVHKGASLVAERVYNPGNLSFQERRKISLGEMSASQRISVAVGLRSLGYDVPGDGADVTQITEGYPADGVIELGDIIVRAEGRPVASPGDLRQAMAGTKPGDAVDLTVQRKGATKDLEVGTTAARGDPERAVMGVVVEPSFDYPVDVKIDTRGVGGPSAGLAFALDVVDELGEDIDQGRKVAVTGTLDLDGRVGPIGGIKQKTFGAREADADVFLVPDANADEARKWADGLEIVAVSDFDEALSYLNTA
jgi:PDZ domain-containing protein